MRNMIRCELYRLIHSKGFYFGLLFICFTMTVTLIYGAGTSIGRKQTGLLRKNSDYIQKSEERDLSSLSAAEFHEVTRSCEGYFLDEDYCVHGINHYYELLFFAAVLAVGDLSVGAAKNTLSGTVSRKKYIAAKFLLTAGISCVLLFFTNLMFFALNRIVNGGAVSSDLWTVTRITLMHLPQLAALSAVLTSIALITRKMSLFNTFSILLPMVGQLLLSLAAFTFRLNDDLMTFEMHEMNSRLAMHPTASYTAKAYAVCAVITLISVTAAWLSFRKAEIK